MITQDVISQNVWAGHLAIAVFLPKRVKTQQVVLAPAMQHDYVTLDRKANVGLMKISGMPIAAEKHTCDKVVGAADSALTVRQLR